MIRVQPRVLIFPSILFFAFFLFILSSSVDVYVIKGVDIIDQNQTNIKLSTSKKQLSAKYPQSIQKWREEIEYSTDQYEIDPNLIAAIMLQESGGQPTVVSISGAVGLMQIMPRDGIASEFICGNHPCFKNRPSMSELFKPDFNIDFGTQLLASLMKTYGSTRKALKAYGPMDVGFYYADLVLSIYSSVK